MDQRVDRIVQQVSQAHVFNPMETVNAEKRIQSLNQRIARVTTTYMRSPVLAAVREDMVVDIGAWNFHAVAQVLSRCSLKTFLHVGHVFSEAFVHHCERWSFCLSLPSP